MEWRSRDLSSGGDLFFFFFAFLLFTGEARSPGPLIGRGVASPIFVIVLREFGL